MALLYKNSDACFSYWVQYIQYKNILVLLHNL